MTLYEFKLLPEQEQYRKLFNEGDFIIYRLEPTARFSLYALGKLYEELEYKSGPKKYSFLKTNYSPLMADRQRIGLVNSEFMLGLTGHTNLSD